MQLKKTIRATYQKLLENHFIVKIKDVSYGLFPVAKKGEADLQAAPGSLTVEHNIF